MLRLSFVVLALATPLAAQGTVFRLAPAATPGGTIDGLLLDRPGRPFLTLIDLESRPQRVLGQTIWLGLSPALTTIDSGLLDGVGARSFRLRLPSIPSLAGLAVFGQGIVLDTASANRAFRASNGESFGIHGAPAILVERFDAPAVTLTGRFDRTIRGRLQALPPTSRLVRIVDGTRGYLFGQPVLSPLNPNGARYQMVIRARDLGATGHEEVLTAIRWRPFGSVRTDDFQRIVLDVSHSVVVPDYRVHPVSALPRFPQSGLSKTYFKNVVPQEWPVRVYDGPYHIRAANVVRGYVPYPAPQQHFTYNGIDSLLLDFKVPSSKAAGLNGQAVYLKVLSSPMPYGVVYSQGQKTTPIDPFRETVARRAGSFMHDYMIELTRVRSDAQSKWLDSGKVKPDWQQPIVASALTPGSSVALEFRGSHNARGTLPTLWTKRIDSADGHRFIQYRVILRAALAGAPPSVDTLLLPFK